MAITMEKLYKNGTLPYKMKLLGGFNGLSNLVQWVHILEDDDATKFLHGNELVFTAGILNKEGDWLLNYAKRLHARGISAFVVNIGPYIKEVPSDVIDYCDEVAMPIFTIPWETRMVDVTRDFCHRIMQNEQEEDSIAVLIQNLIFHYGDSNVHMQQLERFGYRKDQEFAVLAIEVDCLHQEQHQQKMDQTKVYAEKIIRGIHENFATFFYESSYIVVLAGFTKEEVEEIVVQLHTFNHRVSDWKVFIGISENKMGSNHLNTCFEQALASLRLSVRKDTTATFYADLGFYKVLLGTSDKTVLRDFYREILGKLVKYDRENQTNLLDFLHVYMECGGHAKEVSERLYIHRNTVSYQLKKIEKITGLNPARVQDQVKISVCFLIQDII
ncbi:MAG: PucR family transcriptional regulator [Lachnospiraceae bacterium]